MSLWSTSCVEGYKGLVINGVLAQVHLTVGLMGPQTHLSYFPRSRMHNQNTYIATGRIPTLVP